MKYDAKVFRHLADTIGVSTYKCDGETIYTRDPSYASLAWALHSAVNEAERLRVLFDERFHELTGNANDLPNL